MKTQLSTPLYDSGSENKAQKVVALSLYLLGAAKNILDAGRYVRPLSIAISADKYPLALCGI